MAYLLVFDGVVILGYYYQFQRDIHSVIMSSATSAVTYTSVYTDSEPGRAFWGADDERMSVSLCPEEYEDDETEDGPVDYPMDGGDDEMMMMRRSSRDNANDEDEDDEGNEEKGRRRRRSTCSC
ncbi:hypothetical protein Tco_1124351 [Tanacetum coccineum]|uniref:Uncharacterized protein n=1 Tax=Tanacetum coccineum TaxID=301880 RepID=A0ABQ5J6J0_9ASTR